MSQPDPSLPRDREAEPTTMRTWCEQNASRLRAQEAENRLTAAKYTDGASRSYLRNADLAAEEATKWETLARLTPPLIGLPKLRRYNLGDGEHVCVPADDGAWVLWADVVATAYATCDVTDTRARLAAWVKDAKRSRTSQTIWHDIAELLDALTAQAEDCDTLGRNLHEANMLLNAANAREAAQAEQIAALQVDLTEARGSASRWSLYAQELECEPCRDAQVRAAFEQAFRKRFALGYRRDLDGSLDEHVSAYLASLSPPVGGSRDK